MTEQNEKTPFEIVREFEVDASPEEVWEAVTNASGAYLWPMEPPEPKVGGRAPHGATVTVYDAPHHLVVRSEDVGFSIQSVNQLEHVIESRDEGRRAWVRYVHSGIFTDDWDNQYDGASLHTDFYLHTLREYLVHFAPRPVTFAQLDGAEASVGPDALARVARALGLADDAAATAGGTTVAVHGPEDFEAVLDYRTDQFIGLRTDHALIRVFDRNRWGAPVGVSVHDFAADADAEALERAWQGWLDGVFSDPR